MCSSDLPGHRVVHLAAETLLWGGVPSGALLPAIAEPGSPLAAYLTGEVLGGLPAEARRLVRDVVDLAPVTLGLCHALGHRPAVDGLRLLSRIGVLVPTGHGPMAGLRLVPALGCAARPGRAAGNRAGKIGRASCRERVLDHV